MGRKGWGGTPPSDDDDARKRILESAVRCVERDGAAATSIATIAADLGITRPTIYRYFAGIDDVFTAVAEVAFDSWAARLEAHTAHLEDPAELVAETTAYVLERLPEEPLLTLLLSSGRTDSFGQTMFTRGALRRGRALLLQSRIDWPLDDRELDELVELLMRLVHSMILAPPHPARTGTQLRDFLRRWVAPAISRR